VETICPSCGSANPLVARFCMSCASPLSTAACTACATPLPSSAKFCPSCGAPVGDRPTGPAEERRVVTVLFADIVGFTTRSDGADPEEVRRRLLLPFHAKAKEDIERFGGTLDKFIGDAVMGVFGAPVAHEDDPDRAVAASLRILDTIAEINEQDPSLGINVRIGINTGEAFVTFASGPVVGENVAGDVVNTASRLQGAAPPGGIVMGETTYRATRGRFEVEELEPVSVKGKAEPLKVWQVLGRHEAPTEVAPSTAFVGRERELQFLAGTYDWALLHSTLRFITVVGEPGMGRSRLLEEFRARLSERAGPPTWLRGRCLPYGEGVTFLPLRTMVRQHAGIADADSPAGSATRLSLSLTSLGAEAAEQEWLLSRIGPLIGAGGTESVSREEIFGAWSRYLELVASRPLVLVFDDVEFGDPALLDFIRHAADRLATLPVLLVVIARREFLEENPAWAARGDAAVLDVPRMSDEETDELLTELLPSKELPAEMRAALREGAGGNPLFALEFGRMVAESADDGGGAVGMLVPDSLQGLVAARLDALSAAHRAAAHDAAILGDRFWPGAIAALGGVPAPAADDAVADLVRRGLAIAVRDPLITDQREYSFSNALVREVAYRQVPKSSRARKHRAAGEWLESTLRERAPERAELLAFHFAEAVELSEETGEEVSDALVEEARRYLSLAGDRAISLDVGRAFDYFHRALELTPRGHHDRPEIIARVVQAGRRAGSLDPAEAESLMVEAVEQLRSAGDLRAAGRAMVRRSRQLAMLGEAATARAVLAEAIDILEREPRGVELADAYSARAEEEMLAGWPRECLVWADRSISLLGGVGASVEVRVVAYQLRGISRCELGDAGGLEDLGEALQIAFHLGLAMEAAQSRTYLGEATWQLEGPAKGLAFYEQACEQCFQRGLTSQGMASRAESVWMLYDLGEWDRLLEDAGEVIGWAREHGGGYSQAIASPYRARVLLQRGRAEELGAEEVEEFLRAARQYKDLQALAPALATGAMAAGDPVRAAELVEEFYAATRGRSGVYREAHLPDLVQTCVDIERLDLADRLLEGVEGIAPRQRNCVVSARALLAEARGEHEDALVLSTQAGEAWTAFGCPFEAARAELVAARALRSLDRGSESEDRMGGARPTFDRLGAAPWSARARARSSRS
jgi:class 3 adenylate cyclase/tetratricopeptide (TPR) repeat protein